MQTKVKYIILIFFCSVLSISYVLFYRWKSVYNDRNIIASLKSYASVEDYIDSDSVYNPREKLVQLESSSKCRMESCFDFSRCDNEFKVYVYPVESSVPISPSYQKILRIIQSSKYYTYDPSQACIFILSLDTLDRDNLSKDYVRNMPARIQRVPLWNNGLNHIIFTLYTGTYPDYSENLGFDTGKAILAKASASIENFREGFDISLPLFHKTHPEIGGEPGFIKSNKFMHKTPYLLAFKGKRYLYGIGSETRNSLHHLHNAKDIILVTTCRHLDNWKGFKDNRCDQDNDLYDTYDYETLLRNSTFCLVPRGRRLGSFRFLETLQAGCIPIILANKWELPFSEVIDWSQASILGDERLLLQIPDIVRSISDSRQLQMRQQTQILWNQYFSSVEKIVISALEIVRERIAHHRRRTLGAWNSRPGALNLQFSFSDHLSHFPFYYQLTNSQPKKKFTAIIYVSQGFSGLLSSTPFYKLIKNINSSKYAKSIIVIWNSLQYRAPPVNRISFGLPIQINFGNSSLLNRYMTTNIDTDAIFSLNEDTVLSSEELDFAFDIWLTFPDRIIGYASRSVYYNYAHDRWIYSSHWSNSYSIVLTDGAVFHKYYYHVLASSSPSVLNYINDVGICDDLLLNFIVADITGQPPIKLSQRKHTKDLSSIHKLDRSVLDQKSNCLNFFTKTFAKVPLVTSNLRLDPTLFKDKVSIQRKKYRVMEKYSS